MKLDLQYVDPRFVELYDSSNPRGADTDFYIQLAVERNAKTIFDLGCGTGLLTRELAVAGRKVIGVDPALEMVKHAKRQPEADRVTWVCGTAEVIANLNADLAIMTGNVAQVFLDDSEWLATLDSLYQALRPDGCLAFESRNPLDRAWERWNRESTYQISDTGHGLLEEWLDVTSVQNGRVVFEGHNVFMQTGERLIIKSELSFRTQGEIIESLISSGFNVEQVFGDWKRGLLTEKSRAMIFIAKRV